MLDGRKVGSLDEGTNGARGQVVRPHVGKRATRPPDGRPDGGQDVSFDHVASVLMEYFRPA